MATDADDLVIIGIEVGAESEEDLTPEDQTDLVGTTVGSSDWTAETMISQLNKGNINLAPKFQRRDAWTDERKSRFIESLLLGIPIPQIVLAELPAQRGKYLVIDGKQRLLALRAFAGKLTADESALVLVGLRLRANLNGCRYIDLQASDTHAQDVTAFENQPIRTVVLRGWKSESVLYTIFYRLNAGSLPLSPQELRHVLHPGPFMDYSFDFSSSSDSLVWLYGENGKPDFRMRDVELLIRFFALKLFWKDYAGDLKKFLDSAAAKLNADWERRCLEVSGLANNFEAAVQAVRQIFGDSNVFRKFLDGRYERRMNRAVADCMLFSLTDPLQRQESLARRDEVKGAFERLCSQDREFIKSIESTTKSQRATFLRLCRWSEALSEVTGVKALELQELQARIG